MKISFHQSILFSLILFQALTIVQPQLLNNVSHVLDSISEQKPPPSTGQSSTNDNKPNTPSSLSPPPPTSSAPVHAPSAPAAPTPQPTITGQQLPPPTQSSTEKPTTSQKPSDTTTENSTKNTTPPPEANKDKPTPPNTPTTNKPTSNNHDKEIHTPAQPTSTSPASSSSGATNKPPKAPGSKSTHTSDDDDSSNTETSTPSVTNDKGRSTAISNGKNDSSSANKTGTIVGAVVGSIFGVALVGGALTWVNRQGGCAKRSTNKRTSDFEDYGLDDTDFPRNHQQQHLRSPAMQSVGLATNAAAIGSATPILGATSPTIPRLNEQGTFYGNTSGQYIPAYQPHLDANGGGNIGDYSSGQPIMEYNNNNPQPYYYQQQENLSTAVTGVVAGYYEESGYYYDGNSHPQQQQIAVNQHSGNTSYDITAQYNPQQNQAYRDHYTTNVSGGDHYYKPDQRI